MGRVVTLRRVAAEKEAEIARLRAELAAAEAFLGSLRSSIEELEDRREPPAPEAADGPDPLAEVRKLIRTAGKPLYIDELLRGLGWPLSRESREEIRTLLRPWVRRGELFTRPRPSTYGLVELRPPTGSGGRGRAR